MSANLLPTRAINGIKKSFVDAMLSPMSEYGGLYAIDNDILNTAKLNLESISALSYKDLCKHIFKALKLDIDEVILDKALNKYERFSTSPNPAPLKHFKDNCYFLELYHGETLAFKDMALAPFGVLLDEYAKRLQKHFLIICATSGDTGPATLDTFKDASNVSVVCLYPHGKTSEIQKLQMTTQNAKNLKVLGIQGDFDDAQSALKSLLEDKSFLDTLSSKDISLSAANSVNIGRIAFQIIYHIWGYLQLVKHHNLKLGQGVNIIVPSGNFGNILGAFYAKMLGLPFDKLIVATNPNDVLYEFITTGKYDISQKELILSYSPAMDILKSSNVERVLFALYGASESKKYMESLNKTKAYGITDSQLRTLQKYFSASTCDNQTCLASIKECFENGYLIDPHSANGYDAYKKLVLSQNDTTPTIIASTAHFSKFAPSMAKALLNQSISEKDALEKISDLAKASIPTQIDELFDKEEIHKEIVHVDNIKNVILKWLDS